MNSLVLYDALLREGPQTEGINLSVNDKLMLMELLDDIGVQYIEGGWPGSNPKDTLFFKEAKRLKLKHAILTAFGMTRRLRFKAFRDPNLLNLLKVQTSVITIFGKSWDFHVQHALKITLEENLHLIFDSVKFLKQRVNKVFYDAEHFFDGFKANAQYAFQCLKAAQDAGADCLILCDTNGGSTPEEVASIVSQVRQKFTNSSLGIHCHNDGDLAIANTFSAIGNGATQVQGCFNGYGERCGNTNMTSFIATAILKYKYKFTTTINLKKLTVVSRKIDEICNMQLRDTAPYVGKSAFAHKAGVHISAVKNASKTYEHVSPELIGNTRKILMSDMAGSSAVILKALDRKIVLDKNTKATQTIIERIKNLESQGYQFEGSEASFEILVKKALKQHRNFFELIGFRVIVENRGDGNLISEATIKIKVKGILENIVAEGNGPVNVLDIALRKALIRFYPRLREVALVDFKVRVLDAKEGTASKVRVLLVSKDKTHMWGTVGVSDNIIDASWMALVDSIDYKLLKDDQTRK
jgi:2-isopropylmalate synthase